MVTVAAEVTFAQVGLAFTQLVVAQALLKVANVGVEPAERVIGKALEHSS